MRLCIRPALDVNPFISACLAYALPKESAWFSLILLDRVSPN